MNAKAERRAFGRGAEPDPRGPPRAPLVRPSGPLTFEVAAGAGERLDRYLAQAASERRVALSRTPTQGADRSGRGDGRRKNRPRPGDAARGRRADRLRAAAAGGLPLIGEELPLDVVYEDEHLVVIDKPAGLVVHPAPGHARGTLVNALIRHCGASLSGVGGVRRPGIVHRLDKDTSGLLVVAKTDAAHRGLAELFADHGRTGSLEREYLALVWGGFDATAGRVDAAIGRHPRHRERMAVSPEERGHHAVTHWRLIEALGPASLIACRLETGRTHQIRVHMASIGHPLLVIRSTGPAIKPRRRSSAREQRRRLPR